MVSLTTIIHLHCFQEIFSRYDANLSSLMGFIPNLLSFKELTYATLVRNTVRCVAKK